MINIEKPIRVLHVIGIMDRGGAEAMIMNFYRNIDRNKVQFDFVENTLEKGNYEEEIISLGGKIYHCPHFNFNTMLVYHKWWSDFFNTHKEYSVVHGHIGSTASIYLNEAKKHGIFTIAHSHNTNQKGSFKQLLYNILSYRTRFIAHYFFACSNQAGIDRFGTKVASKDSPNYYILQNAIDTETFEFDENVREKTRKELEIAASTKVIGHVGRFMDQKNHEFLIEIFNKYITVNSDTVLLLVGDGPLRSKIEEKVRKLNIENKVKFLGIRTDVQKMMMAMDILVFPSKFEGLPVTLVEAQTAGLPCIISDYVPDECILVNELVTIQKLSENPMQWAKHISIRLNEIRKNYRQDIIKKGFDIKTTAKWIEEFYLEKGN